MVSLGAYFVIADETPNFSDMKIFKCELKARFAQHKKIMLGIKVY